MRVLAAVMTVLLAATHLCGAYTFATIKPSDGMDQVRAKINANFTLIVTAGDQWSLYKAIHNVNMAGYTLSNGAARVTSLYNSGTSTLDGATIITGDATLWSDVTMIGDRVIAPDTRARTLRFGLASMGPSLLLTGVAAGGALAGSAQLQIGTNVAARLYLGGVSGAATFDGAGNLDMTAAFASNMYLRALSVYNDGILTNNGDIVLVGSQRISVSAKTDTLNLGPVSSANGPMVSLAGSAASLGAIDGGVYIQPATNAGSAVWFGSSSKPRIYLNTGIFNMAGYQLTNTHLRALSIYNKGGMTNTGNLTVTGPFRADNEYALFKETIGGSTRSVGVLYGGYIPETASGGGMYVAGTNSPFTSVLEGDIAFYPVSRDGMTAGHVWMIDSATSVQWSFDGVSGNVNHFGNIASNMHLRALSIYNNGGQTNNGSIVPAVSNSYSLGSATKPWAHLYLATNSLYLGTNKMSVAAGVLKLNGASVGGGSQTPIAQNVNYAGYTASNVVLRTLATYPMASNQYDLGTAALPYRHLYLATNSLYLGTNKVTVVAGAMKLNGASVGGTSSSIKWTVEEKGIAYGVQVADSSKTITLTGTTARIFSLPSVAAGDIGTWYTFAKLGSGQLTIDAADSDYIIDSGAGDTVYNNTAGETYATLTLELVTSNKWIATGAFGTWTTTD